MREVTLNKEGQARLRQLFERHNGDRSNLEQLAKEMGGRLSLKQLSAEIRRLGLRFGVATEAQVRHLFVWLVAIGGVYTAPGLRIA